MKASEIVGRAAWTLSDEAFERFTQARLLEMLSEARRQIVLLRPETGATTSTVALTAGTRQSVPSDGLLLLDVIRNMGADGQSPGTAVRRVDRHLLDALDGAWHAATPTNEVEHYCVDERLPREFWVFPPAPADPSTHVEIVYSVTPADLLTQDDDIGLDEAFSGPLLDFTLFRAFGQDTESPVNLARAEAHLASFNQAMAANAGALARTGASGQGALT